MKNKTKYISTKNVIKKAKKQKQKNNKLIVMSHFLLKNFGGVVKSEIFIIYSIT